MAQITLHAPSYFLTATIMLMGEETVFRGKCMCVMGGGAQSRKGGLNLFPQKGTSKWSERGRSGGREYPPQAQLLIIKTGNYSPSVRETDILTT